MQEKENLMPENWSRGVVRTIGTGIRVLRKKRNWTLWQLQCATGISWHTLDNWETGQTAPRTDKLLWLCKTTGWKLTDILTGGKNRVESNEGGS